MNQTVNDRLRHGLEDGAAPRTATTALQVRTGSADSNGMLMFLDDHLIAVLVELTDEIHGDARGRWALENTFGLFNLSAPETFASIEQAWDWLGRAARGTRWAMVDSGPE